MSHDILYDIKERGGAGRGYVRAGACGHLAHHPGGAGPAGRGCGCGGAAGRAASGGSDAEDIKLQSRLFPKTEIS